jgi:tRNA (guanosine-2'-O-)-methyltransferase
MESTEEFKRWQITWSDLLTVGELKIEAEEVVRLLGPHMTEERARRLDEVVAHRSLHVVSVLENIYDKGNVSAVMRSSEAFGFLRMCLVDQPAARFKAANRVSKGTEKWLDTRSYKSATDVARDLKREGYQIWATDLDTHDSIDTIDWTQPTAIVLGNEKEGVSPEMRGLVDGRFKVPMFGFAQSFNISVAAALIFYKAHSETKKLGDRALLSQEEQKQVLANYYLRCFDNPEALLKRHRAGRIT